MSGIDIKLVKSEIESVNSTEGLEELRIKYLGRKGIIAQQTRAIPGKPVEERATFGREVNTLKDTITSLINEKQESLGTQAVRSPRFTYDITMPGIAQDLGRLHPITQVIDEICRVFNHMGFSVVEGPEIETEYNNFTALNIPLEHPSRDAFDTFYIRTQGHKDSAKRRKPPRRGQGHKLKSVLGDRRRVNGCYCVATLLRFRLER